MVGANFRFGHRAAGDVAIAARGGRRARLRRDRRAARRRPAGLVVDLHPHLPGHRRRRRRGRGARPAVRGPRRGGARATSAAASSASPPPTCRSTRARPLPPTACTPAGCGALDTGERYPAAISVGTNPTFDGQRERRVEGYVLDRDDLELYGVEVEISFVERLRGMVRFDSIETLVEAMQRRRRAHPRAAGGRDMVTEADLRPPRLVRRARPALLRRRHPREGARTGWAAPRWCRCCSSRSRRGRRGTRLVGLAERTVRSGSPPAPGVAARRGGGSTHCRPCGARHRRAGRCAGRSASLGLLLPAGDPGAADAAALRHVPVHQHRGLAGGLVAARRGALGHRAVLRRAAVGFLVARLAEELDEFDDAIVSADLIAAHARAPRSSRGRAAAGRRRASTCRPRRRSPGCRRSTWCWCW